MPIYLERCTICNNILVEERCPRCDEGKVIESFNHPKSPQLRSSRAYDFSFALTDTVKEKLEEFGFSDSAR